MLKPVKTDSILPFYWGMGVALTILLALTFFGYQNILRSKESANWVNHTLRAIATIQAVETQVQEIGSSQRAFVISSEKRYADIFNEQVKNLKKHIQQLATITHDNVTQQKAVAQLEIRTDDMIAYCQNVMELIRAGKHSQVKEMVVKGVGQNHLSNVSQLLDQMRDHEEDLLEERMRVDKSTRGFANSMILGGSLLSFFMILCMVVILRRELNRRIAVQKEFNQTSQLQNAMLKSAAFAIIATDVEGKITLFNPAAERLLGYSMKEILGQPMTQFHVTHEIADKALELEHRFGVKINHAHEILFLRAARGITESDHWTYVHKDGERAQVKVTITPMGQIPDHITGYIAIAYDISQQLEFEKAIVQAKEDALAGTKAKSEFLANMSHEIRTPMNAIMGMSELLLDTQLDPEQRKYVEIFSQAGESLLNIINDILDLSKIEAGKFDIDHAPFSISQIIEDSVSIMSLKAHQKHLELVVDMQDNLMEGFIGDGHRLRQILLNILGNAVKFTNRGEILLTVTTENNPDPNLLDLIFIIQDTGIGMTEAQLSQLFSRFNQADSSITKEFGGTGLGLSIVKRLVDLMNGSVEVTSSYGIGSRFTLRIPLEKDFKFKMAQTKLDLSGRRILVVDDSRTNRLITRKILEGQKAIVTEASDGREALTLMKAEVSRSSHYDLILLDCRMPKVDGFTVAEEVQANPSLQGPVLMMLTSDDKAGDLLKSKRLGLKSYLIKPVLKRFLLEAIEQSLSQATQEPNPVAKDPTLECISDSSIRILLVDDNEENRTVIKAYAKKYPYIIDEAKNGREAVALFQTTKYDLVLMDMQMPIMDGYTATREIRQIEDERHDLPTPILALTAFALVEEKEKSMEAGCNEHLSKPISKNAFIQAVEQYTKPIEFNSIAETADLIPDFLAKRRAENLELRFAMEKEEYKFIEKIGHRLRGSAGSYGFPTMTEIGKDLETAGKTQDKKLARKALLQYGHELKKLGA